MFLVRLFRKISNFLIGTIAAFLGVYLALSIAFFNPSDQSFSRASGGRVENVAGRLGAYVSDFFLQFFGLSSILFAIGLLVVGISLLVHKNKTLFFIRFTYLLLALITTSICLGVFGHNFVSSFTAVGGYMGLYLYKNITQFIPSLIILPALLASTFLLYLNASGVGFNKIWQLLATKSQRIEADEEEDYDKDEMDEPLPIMDFNDPVVEAETKPKAKFNILPFGNKDKPKTKPEKISKKKFEISSNFELPATDLLNEVIEKNKKKISASDLKNQAEELAKVLDDFGVKGNILNIHPGPVVTLFEFEPAAGTKSSRVIGLAEDIARSLSSVSARIAVIPGRNALGIELPNPKREMVLLRELLEKKEYQDDNFTLPLILGKDIGGSLVVADLAKMPHLLVAGTTGSGKSVAINTMILSLIYRLTPDQCRFIMIDPKMLELSVYDGIPHLLTPVVTDPGKAVVALKWVVKEMENRYRLMSNLGVRNIASYNQRILEAKAKNQQLERTVQTGFDPETGKPIIEKLPLEMEILPFIVVIVDEMADLMLVAGKDIETSVQRLAQMARAAGIHIIMATQRPSVDVITGVIKANFPTRISFQVTSRIDSRTILNEQGAEQLLGAGDMLHMSGGSRITRVHGPFVADQEVERVVEFLKDQGEPNYIEDVTIAEDSESGSTEFGDGSDELYDKAVNIVLADKKASTSYIQRRLKVGYNKAASLIERMEQEGIVSPANHVGKREILHRR